MYSFFHRLIPPAVQCTELPCSYSGLGSEGNLSLGLLCVGWKIYTTLGSSRICWWWRLLNAILVEWTLSLLCDKFLLNCAILSCVYSCFSIPLDDQMVFGCLFHKKRKTILTATEIYINSTWILQRISCIVCPKKESPYHIKQGSLNKGKHFTFISLHLSSLFIKWE